MTVKQLRDLLNKLPGDVNIILSRDAEGNMFSPLDSVTSGIYIAQTTYCGDFNELHTLGEFDISHAPGESEAVCLWPVN